MSTSEADDITHRVTESTLYDMIGGTSTLRYGEFGLPYWGSNGVWAREQGLITLEENQPERLFVLAPEIALTFLEAGTPVGAMATRMGVWLPVATEHVFDTVVDMLIDSVAPLKERMIAHKFHSLPAEDLSWMFGITAPGFNGIDELRRGTMPEEASSLVVTINDPKIISTPAGVYRTRNGPTG